MTPSKLRIQPSLNGPLSIAMMDLRGASGPYYDVMIVPILLLVIASAGIYEWMVLTALILGGSWLVWRVTERASGKFFMDHSAGDRPAGCALSITALSADSPADAITTCG